MVQDFIHQQYVAPFASSLGMGQNGMTGPFPVVTENSCGLQSKLLKGGLYGGLYIGLL